MIAVSRSSDTWQRFAESKMWPTAKKSNKTKKRYPKSRRHHEHHGPSGWPPLPSATTLHGCPARSGRHCHHHRSNATPGRELEAAPPPPPPVHNQLRPRCLCPVAKFETHTHTHSDRRKSPAAKSEERRRSVTRTTSHAEAEESEALSCRTPLLPYSFRLSPRQMRGGRGCHNE